MRKHDFTDAESVRYLAAVDPDVLLADAYIMKRMSFNAAEAFENRLGVDIPLFEKVWPMIAVAQLERSPAAARARVSMADVLPFAPPARNSRFTVWASRLAAACALITVTLSGLGWGYIQIMAARNYTIERRDGWALTTDVSLPHVWSWDPHSPSFLPFPQGSITLAPNSQITRSMREKRASGDYPFRTLDGEAVISVVPAQRMTFRTSTAQIALAAGHFRIISVPGTKVTTLVVYEGTAAVDRFPATPGAVPPTTVTARHRAIIGRDHSIVVDSIGEDATPEKDFYTRFRERGKP